MAKVRPASPAAAAPLKAARGALTPGTAVYAREAIELGGLLRVGEIESERSKEAKKYHSQTSGRGSENLSQRCPRNLTRLPVFGARPHEGWGAQPAAKRRGAARMRGC